MLNPKAKESDLGMYFYIFSAVVSMILCIGSYMIYHSS